jgi:dolichyl-phosphate-mannose--protein O-mannosyl transferase
LAAIFFIAFVPYARRTISTGKGGALKRGAVPLGVLGLCVSSFILLPLLVYAASYIPTLYVPGYGWGNVWRWQRQMLDYHSQLKATHAFASPWWQWPWIVKPVWYFKADGLSAGMASTIVAMGNPLIFWPSLLALVAATILAFARRDKRMIPILAGFISQYLPWMLVPRLTFLYHYFPIVPFGLLSLINLFKPIAVRGGADALALKAGTSLAARAWVIGRKNILLIYVIACAALFVLFFPAISGLPVPAGWIRALRWSPSWFF